MFSTCANIDIVNHYRYIKKLPVTVTIPLVPFLTTLLGVTLLFWVIWPILSFQVFYTKSSGYYVTPLSDDFIADARAEATQTDFTKASNWFPGKATQKTITTVDSYLLSIPKLRIVNALVKIGSDDLSQNLIHYGGTALPGKYGNAVIFGHSVLPTFYNPADYLTIFSLLPTLKEKDDIFVRFDGIDYRYKVVSQRVTSPSDVSGLEQRYDDSYITLVTCVPPGTYFQRLWLTAKLVPFGQE